MKKIASLGAVVMSAAFMASGAYAGVAQQGSVAVAAAVTESPSTLELDVLSVATGDPVQGGVQFGNQSNNVAPWSTLAEQVIRLRVVNANGWELKTFTDNFNLEGGGVPPADTANWGLQYGGMVAAGGVPKKIGLGWAVKTSRLLASQIATGDPAQNTVNGFTYIKDKADQDLPELAEDQSFQYASGYINVAFGSYNETNVIVANNQDAGVAKPIVKLANANDYFYYYVEGNFSGASAATYGTTLRFDLYNY